jgi:hypothetical protein
MSDFGTIITATKQNQTHGTTAAFTELEEEKLTDALTFLIVKHQALTAEGDLMNAQFEITEKNVAIAPLSEHYFNDDDWEDQYDFVLDNEADYAELLVEELGRSFPTYKFETKLEKW